MQGFVSLTIYFGLVLLYATPGFWLARRRVSSYKKGSLTRGALQSSGIIAVFAALAALLPVLFRKWEGEITALSVHAVLLSLQSSLLAYGTLRNMQATQRMKQILLSAFFLLVAPGSTILMIGIYHPGSFSFSLAFAYNYVYALFLIALIAWKSRVS